MGKHLTHQAQCQEQSHHVLTDLGVPTASTPAHGLSSYLALQVAACPGWVVCVDSWQKRMCSVSFAPDFSSCQGWRRLVVESFAEPWKRLGVRGIEAEMQGIIIAALGVK